MAYTVLARRYRSQSFDEVIGQEPIARTLRAAIEQDRVAHAFLFCGTRGVGKTSMARVFAKALNNPDADDAIDQAIMTGQDTDVIEIDGASNNGVEAARELIGNSAYAPMRGRYKIYIIDEVHMLSMQAFNALLKTMEEPPPQVKFILCTTEAQKVPATIQSRCQRFDFRAIPTARILEHLESVVRDEKLKAEPELLTTVAKLGNGSMRDALSLLDRVIASGEKNLTLALLEELVGLPDRELLGSLVDAFVSADPGAAIAAAGALLDKGTAPELVVDALAERLRDLMVLRACGGDSPLVELSDASREEETARASGFDPAGLSHMIALCDAAARSMRASVVPRAVFDALMVRLALAEKFADVAALVAGSPGSHGSTGSHASPGPAAAPASAGGGASPPSVERPRRRAQLGPSTGSTAKKA